MKKELNNSMNGTATMPSYFPCIKSSESHPLADWLYLKSVITSSPELRMMTETYRKRLAISKQFADQYKPEMPAITVSALMDGYGRQLADFLKPTYMFQLDFDHVKKEDMEQLIQLVRGIFRLGFCCKNEMVSDSICMDSRYLLGVKIAATIIYIFKCHGGDVRWNVLPCAFL